MLTARDGSISDLHMKTADEALSPTYLNCTSVFVCPDLTPFATR